MKAEILEAIAKAQGTIKDKSTFIIGDDWYGVHNLLSADKWRKRKKGLFSSYDIFGEDDCGNEFLLDTKYRVLFWDHETNDVTQISESILVFLSSLKVTPEIILKPGQVKRAWIDPKFLEEQKRKGNG